MSDADRPTFRRRAPSRRGEVASHQADLDSYDRILQRVPQDHPGLALMLQRREELSQAAAGIMPTLELHLNGGDVVGHTTSAEPLTKFMRALDTVVKDLAKSIAGLAKLSTSLRVTPGLGSVMLTLSPPQQLPGIHRSLDVQAERVEVAGLRRLIALMAVASEDDDPTASQLSAAMHDLTPAARRSLSRFGKATADAEYEVTGSWSDSRNGTVGVALSIAAANRIRRTADDTESRVEYLTATGTIDGWEWSTSRVVFVPESGRRFRASVPEQLAGSVAALIADREKPVTARFAIHVKVARGGTQAAHRGYQLEWIAPVGEQADILNEVSG